MDAKAVLFAVVFALCAVPFLFLFTKWLEKVGARRMVARIIAETDPSRIRRPALKPQCDFSVEVSQTGATARRPDGKIESVEWDDLQKVAILTTDAGPFAPDIFWVLIGSKGGCVVPWGAAGEKQLLDRLQALSGFRNDVIVNATSLTSNNLLTCWERPDSVLPVSKFNTDSL